MSLSLYKPNSKNSGAAFTFKFGPSSKGGDLKGDLSLYVSAVLQATWNAGSKTGTFKENAKNPLKTLNIKLSEFEVGGLINSIKRGVESKGYHTFPGSTGHVQFSFNPAPLQDGVLKGFYFSILRDGKDRFAIPVSAGEAETLAAFLDFGLKTTFANRFRAQQATRPVQAPVQQQRAPEPEQDNAFEPAQPTVEEAPPQEEDEAAQNPFG